MESLLAGAALPVVRIERDDARIEAAVRHIRAVCAASHLEAALRIGTYVLDTFFGGDREAFRARGRRDVSFRRLAKHPDLPVSATYLWRSVAIVEQLHDLPAEVAQALPLTHHQVLLLVNDREEKVRLAREAVGEVLSKRAFARRVQEVAGGQAKRSRGGRPRTPPLMRLQKLLRDAMVHAPALDHTTGVTASEALAAADQLEEHARQLLRTADALRGRARHARRG
jgi:hypothetical protein